MRKNVVQCQDFKDTSKQDLRIKGGFLNLVLAQDVFTRI